jgi:hypothetical protein
VAADDEYRYPFSTLGGSVSRSIRRPAIPTFCYRPLGLFSDRFRPVSSLPRRKNAGLNCPISKRQKTWLPSGNGRWKYCEPPLPLRERDVEMTDKELVRAAASKLRELRRWSRTRRQARQEASQLVFGCMLVEGPTAPASV